MKNTAVGTVSNGSLMLCNGCHCKQEPNNEERKKSCILKSFFFCSQSQKATERPLSLHLHHPSCVRLNDEMQFHLHSGCTGNDNTPMILMDRELVMGLEVYFGNSSHKCY